MLVWRAHDPPAFALPGGIAWFVPSTIADRERTPLVVGERDREREVGGQDPEFGLTAPFDNVEVCMTARGGRGSVATNGALKPSRIVTTSDAKSAPVSGRRPRTEVSTYARP
jgi:hypothetical protein